MERQIIVIDTPGLKKLSVRLLQDEIYLITRAVKLATSHYLQDLDLSGFKNLAGLAKITYI